MKHNKNMFLILLLIIPALACSTSFTEPAANLSAGVSIATATPAPTPSNTITPTATASPEKCAVTAEALHLRDAPNIEGAVIAWLNQGDQLTILPDPPSGAWLKVMTGDNLTGWINSIYCMKGK